MPTARHLPVLPDDFDPETDLPQRPRTRGDCVGGPRPCPWAGCRQHLGLEVNRDTGHLKVVLDPEQLELVPETCSLDVADRAAQGDEVTLDEVGQLLGGLTRERVRQIEAAGLRKLQRKPGRELAKYRSMREPGDH